MINAAHASGDEVRNPFTLITLVSLAVPSRFKHLSTHRVLTRRVKRRPHVPARFKGLDWKTNHTYVYPLAEAFGDRLHQLDTQQVGNGS